MILGYLVNRIPIDHSGHGFPLDFRDTEFHLSNRDTRFSPIVRDTDFLSILSYTDFPSILWDTVFLSTSEDTDFPSIGWVSELPLPHQVSGRQILERERAGRYRRNFVREKLVPAAEREIMMRFALGVSFLLAHFAFFGIPPSNSLVAGEPFRRFR